MSRDSRTMKIHAWARAGDQRNRPHTCAGTGPSLPAEQRCRQTQLLSATGLGHKAGPSLPGKGQWSDKPHSPPAPSPGGSGSEQKGCRDNRPQVPQFRREPDKWPSEKGRICPSHRGPPDILHPHQGDESQEWHWASRNSPDPALPQAPTFRAGPVHSDLADTRGRSTGRRA